METLLDRLGPELPVYVCRARDFLNITGFNMHRGCLALVERPAARSICDVLHGARTVVVLEAVANAPTTTRWVVVAAEPVTSIDVTAADAISDLDSALQAEGIELCFAEMKDPVKDKLKRFGLFNRLGEDTFFATIGQAVNKYLETHPVEWVDWEDRK